MLSSWSYILDGEWGPVFNQTGDGTPVYFRNQDQGRVQRTEHTIPNGDIEWVTVGTRSASGVHVLGSARVVNGSTSRRMHGYDEGKMPGTTRLARIPRWRVTLHCEMDSFIGLPGPTYQEALERMFGRAGVRG